MIYHISASCGSGDKNRNSIAPRLSKVRWCTRHRRWLSDAVAMVSGKGKIMYGAVKVTLWPTGESARRCHQSVVAALNSYAYLSNGVVIL
jgi:hypothetical protein